ncbi:MAG: hypothetical protein WC850_01225 [Candidatus Gracilibacteria bacterium]
MLTTARRTEQTELYDRTQLSTTRNLISSERINGILNFFEGGDGSRLISDEITEYIANLEITPFGGGPNFTINSDPSHKEKLLKEKSLKDKLAFYISLFGRETARTVNLDDYRYIQDSIRNGLNNIEHYITNNFDLSQKFILRHSALNSFKPKLNSEERKKLDKTILKLKEFVEKEKLDKYTFHFGQTNDAQKIKKIEEVFRILSNSDLSSESKEKLDVIATDFNLSDKLTPLDELDHHYEDMSTALNNMYTYNRGGMRVLAKSSRILRNADKRRLNIILAKIEGTDRNKFNEKTYIKKLFDEKRVDLNIELEKILNDEKIKDALQDANMTEEHFTRAYLEHYSQEFVIVAKQRLDSKRKQVFGVNKKDYDSDINLWQKNQRQKVISIGEDIQARGYATDDEIFILTNYLKKSKHIYILGANEEDNINLRIALDSAIANVTPNSNDANRLTLRNGILTQNEHINPIFYGDDNRFDSKQFTDRNGYAIANFVRRTSAMTSIFSKNYGQATAKALVGGTAIGAATYAGYAGIGLVSAIGATSVLAGAGLATGAFVGAKYGHRLLNSYHSWLSKERKGIAKGGVFPLKIAKLVTYPLEIAGQGIDIGSSKIVDLVKNTRTRTNEIIENRTRDSEFVKTLTPDKVNNITSLVAFGLNGLFRGASELTTVVSNLGLDIGETRERAALLNGIYSTQNAQNMAEMAEQVDIQSIIQEDIGLYEKDGFVDEIKITKASNLTKDVNKRIKYYFDKVSDRLTSKAENLQADIDSRAEELSQITDQDTKITINSVYSENKRVSNKVIKNIKKLDSLFKIDVSKMDKGDLKKHFEDINSIINEIYILLITEIQKNNDRITDLKKPNGLIEKKEKETRIANAQLSKFINDNKVTPTQTKVGSAPNPDSLVKAKDELYKQLSLLNMEKEKLESLTSDMESIKKPFELIILGVNKLDELHDLCIINPANNDDVDNKGKEILTAFSS